MEPSRASGRPLAETFGLQEKDETMLVLTRKQGETIEIGNGITIKVIRSAKGAVKIGIEAPADVRVLRGELVETQTVAQPSSEPNFKPTAGRHVAVDYAGYFPLPQTA